MTNGEIMPASHYRKQNIFQYAACDTLSGYNNPYPPQIPPRLILPRYLPSSPLYKHKIARCSLRGMCDDCGTFPTTAVQEVPPDDFSIVAST